MVEHPVAGGSWGAVAIGALGREVVVWDEVLEGPMVSRALTRVEEDLVEARYVGRRVKERKGVGEGKGRHGREGNGSKVGRRRGRWWTDNGGEGQTGEGEVRRGKGREREQQDGRGCSRKGRVEKDVR